MLLNLESKHWNSLFKESRGLVGFMDFGTINKITKMDAVVSQLDSAIWLYLDGKYIPALTLAGAAEDISKNMVNVGTTAYKYAKKYLQEELGFTGEQANNDIVGARNWLKHWDKKPQKGREIDDFSAVLNLKKESLTAITKALFNIQNIENFVIEDKLPAVTKIIPEIRSYLSHCENQT